MFWPNGKTLFELTPRLCRLPTRSLFCFLADFNRQVPFTVAVQKSGTRDQRNDLTRYASAWSTLIERSFWTLVNLHRYRILDKSAVTNKMTVEFQSHTTPLNFSAHCHSPQVQCLETLSQFTSAEVLFIWLPSTLGNISSMISGSSNTPRREWFER